MSYQKCPICEGSGQDPFIVTGSFSSYPCPTCNGARIISQITGLPPIIEEKHSIFEPVEPCMSDVQNAFICNPESDLFAANTLPTHPSLVEYMKDQELKYKSHCQSFSTQNPTQDDSHI